MSLPSTIRKYISTHMSKQLIHFHSLLTVVGVGMVHAPVSFVVVVGVASVVVVVVAMASYAMVVPWGHVLE